MPFSEEDRVRARRRVPQQDRSRDRVTRILEAAARLVLRDGVDTLTTRAIAAEAGVPVPTLYQYFADKEAVLLALVGRDVAEMDAQVHHDVAALEVLSVRTIVETTMRAYVKVYLRRPAFVMIYLRGRSNPEIRDFCRDHTRRLAQDLFSTASGAGIVHPDSTGRYAEIAVEVGDRVFQLAFEHSLLGDPLVIEEGIALVSAYLERHATPDGITGVPAPGVLGRLR